MVSINSETGLNGIHGVISGLMRVGLHTSEGYLSGRPESEAARQLYVSPDTVSDSVDSQVFLDW
jgi:hypothetical protein